MKGKEAVAAARRRAHSLEVELMALRQQLAAERAEWKAEVHRLSDELRSTQTRLRENVAAEALDGIVKAQETARQKMAAQKTTFTRRAEAALQVIVDHGDQEPLGAKTLLDVAEALGVDCGPAMLSTMPEGNINRKARRRTTTQGINRTVDEIRQGKHKQSQAHARNLLADIGHTSEVDDGA